MVGPLIYDLAKQHVSELRAERDMDRLAAQVPGARRKLSLKLDFGRLLATPPHRHSGAALG